MESSVRPKPDRRKNPRSDQTLTTTATAAVVITPSTEDAIARRAYELFCARGCQDGYDVQDWLAAEREFMASLPQTTRKRVTRRTKALD